MLTGVKVLDLSRVLAGPLCSMMLGDLGAHVIKVEQPGKGDDTRGWGPPFDERGESAYYLSVNRNKLGIAADLDTGEGRELIEQLIAGADVVVDNFRPGSLERRNLDPLRLCERHDRLVWCSITGFDPGDLRPGYDVAVQAEAGWMSITGDPSGAPMKMGVALADVTAGKDACIAVLAALYAVRGGGVVPRDVRRITISLVRSATAALVNVAQNVLVTGSDAPRWGNAHPNLVPYQAFEASDRTMIIAVGSDAQWRACTEALGLHALAADPLLATNAGRVRQRARVVGEMARAVRRRSAAESIAALVAAEVPCGMVKTVLERLREVDASALTGLPPSVPGSVRLPPPRLDEHSSLVRRRGWDAFTS